MKIPESLLICINKWERRKCVFLELEWQLMFVEGTVEIENHHWCQNSGQKFDEELDIYIVPKCAPIDSLLITR